MTPAPTTEQDRAYRALCNDYAAVARLELPAGELSLIARDIQGDVQATRVISRRGDPLEPLQAVEALIAARATAQRQVAQATEHLRLSLQTLRDNDDVELNVSQLARDTGIPRSTFYEWVGQAA
jgi:hypothetical protein